MQNRTKRIIKLNQMNYENVKNIRHRSRGKFKMFSLLIYWVSFPYFKRHALFVTNLVSVTKTKEQERIRRHEIRGQSKKSESWSVHLLIFVVLLFKVVKMWYLSYVEHHTNKPGRANRCVRSGSVCNRNVFSPFWALIGGFAWMLRDGHTDGQTLL